ncbi:C2H2 transcription factor (AmdA) [Histoplasma capsulatum]|uniref:C2H2 transcription factor (AmdA) n=1 Tax=Ajellomyces capsulatus TaxID=5037 RepID=A0A8A1M0H4_AJECA|nr:C2H2 transcription factor (AmdA) [Histoplasma capsulatum]
MDSNRPAPGRVRKKSTSTSRKSLSCDDLLVRHERLVHPPEGNVHRGENRVTAAAEPSSSLAAIPAPRPPQSSNHDSHILNLPQPVAIQSPEATRPDVPVHAAQIAGPTQFNPSWGYDLNLLSHAASHVALEGQQESLGPIRKTPVQEKPITENYGVEPSILDLADLGDPVQDFTVFLESVGLSSDWDSGMFSTAVEQEPLLPGVIPPHSFDPKQSMNPPKHNSGDIMGDQRTSTEDAPSFSNFGSRLPSLQPESQDPEDRSGIPDETAQNRPAWDVSNQDRQLFIARLEDFVHVLPKGFVPPSRHALSRFFAGYINGLNEHLPFIHVPTLSVARCPPELSLALAAAGSHYRFENNRGIDLFYASKSILLERLRRRDSRRMPQVPWGFGGPSPALHCSQTSSSISNPGSSPFQQPYISTVDSATYPGEDSVAQMEIIRTFLLLTVFASWERHPELLREILALQSTLARLVRDHGLTESISSPDTISWEDWVTREADRRTKLIVYCFFNLHSIMYNIPPLILSSELKLNMPGPAGEWKAPNAAQWRRLHRSRVGGDTSFQEAFMKLFIKSPQSNSVAPISPLGNYVLIHAIIQQIFFARQLCLSSPQMSGTSLRPEDLSALDSSLSSWKAGWRRTPESSIDPQSPAGPIAFTSTALLGLAYIRLHLDLGPCRKLVTQDPLQIARALKESTPLVVRNPRLTMALLHSAHALSIPVRLGIDFVAKTHSFFWSIQHSICSLECAFLLSRWLLAIPATRVEQGLSDHERKLLLWVKSMMEETNMVFDMANVCETAFINDPLKLKELSVAVVRVWSRTFKGNTSWPIVDLIGSSLEIYADLLES